MPGDSDGTLRVSVEVAADQDDPEAREALEEVVLGLRTDLADAGVIRVDEVPLGEAPEGARVAGVLEALSLAITLVSTIESAVKMVQTVRRWAIRYAERRKQRLRLKIAGQDVDLAAATDAQVHELARSIVDKPVVVPTGVRKALVVANANYDDPKLARLRSPAHDADALSRVLGDPAIGGFDVELLLDADERTVRRGIAAFFANRDRDDLLLLHFSCHGVKDIRGRLHLATRDTDLSVLSATSIPAGFVNDQMSETQSRRVILMLDCCYSGAFARGGMVRSGSEVSVADEFGVGAGRVVLTASSATEYAFEGGELTRAGGLPSVFTSALVRGLRTGEADLDADGEISINELYDYTYRAVRAFTPGQAPMKWSFGVEGDLVVARSVRPAALPVSIRDDLASERVPLRLAAVQELANLYRGDKLGLRAAAAAALAQLRDGDDSAKVRDAAGQVLGARARATVPPPASPARASATKPVPPPPSPPPPATKPVPPRPSPPPRPAATPARPVAAAQPGPPQPPPPMSPAGPAYAAPPPMRTAPQASKHNPAIIAIVIGAAVLVLLLGCCALAYLMDAGTYY
jgi:hypothetical protein